MKSFLSFIRRNLGAQIAALILVFLVAFSLVSATTTISTNIDTGGTITTTGNIYANGAGALFNVSSTTALVVQNGSGTNRFAFDTTTTGSGLTMTATTTITTGGEGSRGILVNAGSSQWQNLFQLNNSSSVFLSGFTGAGGFLMNISSTTAFTLQNGSGTNQFVVDTSSATASTTMLGGLVADTNTFVVNANENVVGIGTASPTSTFTVVGASRMNGNLRVTGTGIFDSTLQIGGSLTLANSDVIGNTTATNIFLSGTTISIATSTASTTAGALWVAAPAGTTTTTLQINGNRVGEPGSATKGSCIQMWRETKAYRVYINTAGTGLIASQGSCND